MKYSKELHEHALQRIHDQGEVISFGTPFVESLLEEISHLQAERRWIPVSERLPEDNGTGISEAVLTCYETNGGSGAVTIRALLNTGMWFDTSTGFLVNPANVTHWMPLPEPPEDDNDQS